MERWEWGNEGVVIENGHLVWYEAIGSCGFASGAACEQTFKDFIAHGPRVPGAPEEVIEQVRQAVRTRLGAVA